MLALNSGHNIGYVIHHVPSRFGYGVRVYSYAISIFVKNTASNNLWGKLYGKEADSFSVGKRIIIGIAR